MLKGSREQADVEFAGRVVTEMINQFTEYLFSFDKEVMTAKEQDHLANIINENLLKIGGKVDFNYCLTKIKFLLLIEAS